MDLNPLQIVLDSVESIVAGFFASIPQMIIALIVLVITLFVARIVRAVVRRIMQGARVRSALITLATNLIGIAAWIIGVAVAIMIVVPSVTPAQFIAGLGLTSVAIGFAFKDVFENFLAGVIILGREKMQIGDVIECEGVYGRIENIWIRETHVRRVDGELVIVPNAFLFQNPLRIQTDRNRIRQELIVGVDSATDLPTAKRVLREALDNCKSIDTTLERAVQCVSFGGSSIDFQILWWTESQPADQRSSFHEVAFAVKAALDKAEITIPFPQTTLSLRPEHVPFATTRAA